MKKKITLTISEQSLKFLNENFINISAWFEAQVQQKIRQSSINIKKENKELEDVFDDCSR